MQDSTLCVHHPKVSKQGFASLAVPTYRASTIVFDNAEEYARRKQRGADGYTYGMSGTPTSRTLEAQLTQLHRGVRTIVLPSGQAAIAAIMLATLMPGDEVLLPDNVYPPVKAFCAGYLELRGIQAKLYPPRIGSKIGDFISERTRLVWVESPGPTTMEMEDVPAIVAAAHARGILVGCDNTWATPLLYKPLLHGVDFVMEALTKYVGGHSDILLGSISVREQEHFVKLKAAVTMLGYCVSPDECSLALRGIETLGVRVRHSGDVALRFAHQLAGRFPTVEILHPGLPSFIGHDLWKRDFAGASGVFSVVLDDAAEDRLEDALSHIRVFAIGASWGGTRSLLAPMSVSSDRSFGDYGKNTILRISIGLEDEHELWIDLCKMLDFAFGN